MASKFMKLPLKKSSSRIVWGLLAAAVALGFVTLAGTMSLSADDLTDAQKRLEIDSMYEGYKKQFPAVSDISPRQAMVLAADHQVVFIDIREAKEQQVSMLPGAITEKMFLKDPDKYKDDIKIAYCTISYRSGLFARKLNKKGIPVYNLRGGLLAWVHDGGKVYDQNGQTHRIHVYGSKWNLGPEDYQAVW